MKEAKNNHKKKVLVMTNTMTFYADQIYLELKRDILNEEFRVGELISPEYVIQRFGVCRSFALEALTHLSDMGLLTDEFYVRLTNEKEYLMMSRLKMTFFNLSFAVHKVQEKKTPYCLNCLKGALFQMKHAAREVDGVVFKQSIQRFYGCMIEFTELRTLDKNITYLVETLDYLEAKNPEFFYGTTAKQVICYLEDLVNSLERQEFDRCHKAIESFYSHNLELLFR